MIIDLNDFDRVETKEVHVSLLKHRNNNMEIICKQVTVKKGLEEIGIYQRLNSAGCNCVPQMLDYEIVLDKALIYLTHIKGCPLIQFKNRPDLINTLVDNFDLVFENAVESVKSLHRIGIYHRDIKPDNIIVDDQYRVFLVDFGVASQKNCIGDMVGTTRFLSPEAIFRPAEIDETSDFYSLSASFRHILADELSKLSYFVLERMTSMSEIQKKNRKCF